MNISTQIQDKLISLPLRLLYWLRQLPIRFLRLLKHILSIFTVKIGKRHWWQSFFSMAQLLNIGDWIIVLFFLLCDIFAIGEIYEMIADFTKFNTRSLKAWEVDVAKTIFKDKLQYKLIRIDENAKLLPSERCIAYVGFHTINSKGPMNNSTFIHELVHVWQYERFGSVYIYYALMAQKSTMGYNYGGASALSYAINQKKKLVDFNFEQQGDLIEDYYRISNGYAPTWGLANQSKLHLYKHFVEQL